LQVGNGLSLDTGVMTDACLSARSAANLRLHPASANLQERYHYDIK
jgi:hypothetical protein